MIQQNKGDIHLFTTNHPWFLEIGLSSFTTGTLIDWWNQKTADGRYLNRRHINSVSSSSETLFNPPNDLRQLLGISPTTEFFWEQQATANLFDAQGNLVMDGISQGKVECGHLMPGMYVLVSGSQTFKLVIQPVAK
jgi:hypothetical protein